MPSINDRADAVLAPVALHAAQKTENTIRYVLISITSPPPNVYGREYGR
jgi:hypothetical protein